MARPGPVLRRTMRGAEALQPLRPRRLCVASPVGVAALADPNPGIRLAPARRRVLEVLRAAPPLPAAGLAPLPACGPAVVRHPLAVRYLPSHPPPPNPP